MKSKISAIGVVIITIVGFFILPWENENEVNWNKTFVNTDTNPYGAYILYSFLDTIFTGKIETTRETAAYTLREDYNSPTSYIFVNEENSFSETDYSYLQSFIDDGNNVFISSEYFYEDFEEIFGISIVYDYDIEDSIFLLNDFQGKEYVYSGVYTFFNVDSCNMPYEILAESSSGEIIFLRAKSEKGYLYLHSNPSAFVNINLLDTTKYDFAFRCLSYLPHNSNVIWDEFQKQGLIGGGSRFRVLLANMPLRIALYLAFISGLLYMLFGSKRIQRIIPEVKPPVNSSVEFLETVGNLYYRKRDFKTIAMKRHAYFLDFVRKNYFLSTENIDGDFFIRLHEKSGVGLSIIKRLFERYKHLIEMEADSDIFIRYNNVLEDFYRQTRRVKS